MHRIHSTAKVHALERSISPSNTATQQSTNLSPNPPKVAPRNAIPGTSARSPASSPNLRNQGDATHKPQLDGHDSESNPSASLPPTAPPPDDTKEKQVDNPPIEPVQEKPSLPTRMKAGFWRFLNHTKDALLHSWINVLLIFVPIGIAVNFAPLPENAKPTVVFAMNAVAIIPLAGLLSHATESVASRMGDTWASLLNVTFGNAVELIIFIIALAKNEIRIVQASILGSILANLLLILGMSFLLGGLRFREQIYNSTVTQMSACLLSLSVMSLLLPTAFHASFHNYTTADERTVKISRGTSVVLLLVYVLYLLFQLKSHAYMYESTPQAIIDEESHPGVLADMMNSSSESSSSESSTDSEASSGSENATKRRIKKAWRHRKRRKSYATSTQTTTTSIISSPSVDGKSGANSSGSPGESYFDAPQRSRRDPQFPSTADGDEADTEGERENGVPRVRDFEAEQGESVRSTKKKDRKAMKKHKKTKSKDKKQDQASTKEDAVQTYTQEIVSPRVDFVEEPEQLPATPGTRRPFAISQISRPFVPQLTNVFANTVFSNTQAGRPPATNQSHPSSNIRRSDNNLRRTSSLPDRFDGSRQPASHYAPALLAQRSDGLPPTQVEAVAEDDEKPHMSRTAAVMLLLFSTGFVAFCAELLVDAIPDMIKDTSVSQAFIGLIVLPIVGNAAEHVTAVTVAAKNKMDLAIGVSVGSSIQIALFITPVVVILGWIMDKDMSLYFNLFETVSLFVTAFVVNFLVLDGRSNYLEGSLLIAAYIIIALAAFFYPNKAQQSALGGGSHISGY